MIHCSHIVQKLGIIFDTYNFDKFVKTHCEKLSGHSRWFDVKFSSDGSLQSRSAPCGDIPETESQTWMFTKFLKCADQARSFQLSSLGRSREETMSAERREFLFKTIRPFAALGNKRYNHRSS